MEKRSGDSERLSKCANPVLTLLAKTRQNENTDYTSHSTKSTFRTRPIQQTAPVENVKEIQQKLKEEREAKRAQLDGRHDYVLSIVASCLDLEKADVEDAILEGTQIDRMEHFFAAGGLSHIMFYYQEVEPTEAAAASLSRNKKPKVFVTEGRDVALNGVCVFFTRANNSKAISSENVHRDVNFNMLDTTEVGLLKSVEQLLSEIFIPTLKKMHHGWGELANPQALAVRQDFLSSLESFVAVLGGAQESLMEKVTQLFPRLIIKTPVSDI